MTEHLESETPARLFDRRLLARMLAFARPYRAHLLLAVIGTLPLIALANSLPLLIRDAVDRALLPPGEASGIRDRWTLLLKIAGLYVALAFCAFVLRVGHSYLMSWLGQRMLFDMRAALFGKILRLPFRYFDRHPVGRLMTRVGSDVEAMQRLLTDGLVGISTDLLMLAGVLGFMFWVNAKLAAIMLALFPCMLALLIFLNAKVRGAHRAVRRRQASLNAYLQEALTGMTTIQLFNREAAAQAAFARHNTALRDAFLHSVKWFSFSFPATEIMGAVAAVAVLAVGGSAIARGDVSLTVGELLAFLAYIRELFRPLDDLSEKSNILQSAMASAERVFGLMDETEERDSPSVSRSSPPTLRGEIAFDNIWFAYDDEHWVLRDLTVHIAPGTATAIVGATGAGKSSLVALLSRFYEFQRGVVRLDGIDVREYPLQELRRRIGVVMQEPFLFAGTIADNIALFDPTMPRARIEEAARFVNAHDFIMRRPRGYDAPVMERGAGLSTGQKQLIALARAIAHNPDILLILDEATANVDTETERLIQEALSRLMKGRTSLIIAHRLSTIRHADLILVLRQGRLVESGTHRELLERGGYYARLYEYLLHAPSS